MKNQHGNKVPARLSKLADSRQVEQVHLNPLGPLGVMKNFGLKISPKSNPITSPIETGLISLSSRYSCVFFSGQSEDSPFIDYSIGKRARIEEVYRLGTKVAEAYKQFRYHTQELTDEEIKLAKRIQSQRTDLVLRNIFGEYISATKTEKDKFEGYAFDFEGRLVRFNETARQAFPYATFEVLQNLVPIFHTETVRISSIATRVFGLGKLID